MITVLVLVAGAHVAGAYRSVRTIRLTELLRTSGGGCDLPCPWCLGATGEEDAACPSCGHPFG